MTFYFFAAALILLSMVKSVFPAFAEAAAPHAAVNIRNRVFALHGRNFDGDHQGVAAVEMNRVADLLPRDNDNTVTTTVMVTICESAPPASLTPPSPGTTALESLPTSATPPVPVTTPVEPTPPGVTTTVSSANTPGKSVSSTPLASETTGTAPPPGSELSSVSTDLPPASSGSTSINVPAESTPGMSSSETSSFPPSSARTSRASTTTAPAATSSSPPPAPNTGDQVNCDKAAIVAGMIFAAIAVV